MLALSGAPLPPAQLDQIANAVRAATDGAIVEIYAEYVHVLNLIQPLTNDQQHQVDALLAYETSGETNVISGTAPTLTVVPRLGTISPWSSKATEIFKLTGLDAVRQIERGVRWWLTQSDQHVLEQAIPLLYDRMTETVLNAASFEKMFQATTPKPLVHIALGHDASQTLHDTNRQLGLALSDHEIDYLVSLYGRLQRDPTDVELMMFAQANSEHCRHKIFNANWTVDGVRQTRSLFQSIRNTAEIKQFAGLVKAYDDNAAVIDGAETELLHVNADSQEFVETLSQLDILMKVETHNHPTAISPYAGAATGSGGEIRDEGAVGRGSKPKAGLVGYTTSHLRIDGDPQPWETDLSKPDRIASAYEIMQDGPLGAAGYNNEYGRPALLGYFRTFERRVDSNRAWGYHKPVLIAGGVGSIRRAHVAQQSRAETESELLIVLGGPAMLIGLGGGAASSMRTGSSTEDLDFASVQRDNAEMERRCQEVIDSLHLSWRR